MIGEAWQLKGLIFDIVVIMDQNIRGFQQAGGNGRGAGRINFFRPTFQHLNRGGANDWKQQDQSSFVEQTGDGFGSRDKEAGPMGKLETSPVVKVEEGAEVEPEVEGWLEKLERQGEIDLPDQIVDDNGNVVLSKVPAVDPDEVIFLPVTEVEMEQGLAAKLTDSAKWLTEWAKRLMKMFGNQVQYREPQ